MEAFVSVKEFGTNQVLLALVFFYCNRISVPVIITQDSIIKKSFIPATKEVV